MAKTDAKTEKAVRKFLDKVLLPLAAKLEKDGVTYFPAKPDASQESYYVTRKRTTMRPEDFEGLGCESLETLESELERLWRDRGTPELIPLARPIAKLARQVYNVEDEQGDVSPFIYAMY